jgi:protein-S-isoprenylcysteine O-methyltransferase Ste14
MGGIPQQGVILIAISGAAFSVLVGYAIFRFWIQQREEGIRDMSNEQKDYMREVRMRNKGLNYSESHPDRSHRRYTETSQDA